MNRWSIGYGVRCAVHQDILARCACEGTAEPTYHLHAQVEPWWADPLFSAVCRTESLLCRLTPRIPSPTFRIVRDGEAYRFADWYGANMRMVVASLFYPLITWACNRHTAQATVRITREQAVELDGEATVTEMERYEA